MQFSGGNPSTATVSLRTVVGLRTKLNRHDHEVDWRALARGSGVSEEVVSLLWARAESVAANDPMKAVLAFRRMLEEAKALDSLALELGTNEHLEADPGKSTRVLVEEQRLPGGTAEPSSREPAISPATRLRHALEAAIQRGESVVRTIASSDARTITDALRRLGHGPGSALAAIDPDALAQLLRLADALVTMVEQGRGAGEALPASLRHELESRIGADLGDLRVHNDPAAAALASRHDAVAFAQGSGVFFADGMYDPSSAAGKQLIAHEAAHVVQQRGNGRAASGAMSEPGSAVEREADRVASAFAAGLAPGAPEFAVTERAAAGTISRKDAAAPAAGATAPDAPAGPKEWKLSLLGQVLDLSSRLAGARDGGNNDKVIDVNQSLGPLRIQQARFKVNGDKVASGTLVASVDSGAFKGSTGTLTVDAGGQVSGTLTVPINVPGLLVKEVSLTVGAGSITGKARLSPSDFAGPDFSIKTSDFELSVTSSGSGIAVGLTGSAMVGIDNGLAQGQAKMDVALHADSSGVSFNATITGKIDIAGIASANAVMKYDGKAVTIEAGGTVPVQLPGLEGTANIKYEKGKLSLDSKDLHFTLPQLAPVKFDEVQATQSKLAAKLHLGSPITVPLPGGASLTLEQSSIAIDGTVVNGDITGTFALNNAGGLTGKVKLAYERGGDITGSVDIAGGAKFTVGGVEITIDNASKLTVAKGMGVSGDVAGKIKIAGLPEVAVHVVAQTGQPIDLTCDAHIPLASITSQLGGDVHVQYHRGGGANAFTFEASNITVAAKPINGQVIFSSLTAHIQGKELTGSLTAASGTVIQAGGATVTIEGGTVNLLPGRILDGQLRARTDAGQTGVEAKVGWTNGKFDWAAEGVFDLAALTNRQLLGQVRAAAGSDGTGNFEANGPITFGNPALAGIQITHLSGDRTTSSFTATVNAEQAVTKAAEKLPNVDLKAKTATATITYGNGSLTVDGGLEGHAQYPKTGPSQLEGDFHLTLNRAGFTGKIDNVKLTASQYFKSDHGSAELDTGIVSLGAATFEVPGVCKGAVNTANINLKTNQFQVEADVDATAPALQGLKIKVILDNHNINASLRENAPKIPLGSFATLTVGGGSTVSLAQGGTLSAHLVGTVDATGLGKGNFQFDYANKTATGNAQVHVEPFAMFDAVNLDLKIDENRKVSTNAAIELRLARQFATVVAASATVTVTDNKFDVTGHVTEVKGLGKISEAFQHGGGAVVTYNQESRKVTATSTFDVGGSVIPELATGSTLRLAYDNGLFSMIGTLKPKSFGAVQFSSDSNIKASWFSIPNRLVVEGQAHAEIAELGTADFTVDSSLGGGAPGSFGLKGHIDPTKLSQHFPGVTFSNVVTDFSVVIGGGQQTDLSFHFGAGISGIPAAGVTEMSAQVDANYKNREGLSGTISITRAKLGEVIASGQLQLERNKFKSGSLHLAADFPSLTVEGTGTVTASELGALSTMAELKVTPGGGSALAKFVQSGSIHVDIQKWKLANAVGQLHLVPPEFLPIENTVIEVGYQPGPGLHATLSTQFNAPMAKHGEKGTFVAGYERARGLYAHIEFPLTVPGFQAAKVAGDLDGKGIRVGATLVPKDATIVKQANIDIGYEFNAGLYLQGSITLKPSEELELVVGLRYDQKAGLQVLGITPNDKAATPQDHEIANWHKNFPTIPLATVGVASLGLKFGLGVAAGYRVPRISFKNPQLEGGLEALDKGGMPAFTFGGQIAMGAYIALSLSVQVVGEIQLLIATCSAGIGAEIAARLNLDLGADVNGRFAPGQGALLQIDPFVGASLDLVASLIATLHASVCWFTIVDKKWTLASTNFAHIELGSFHPFNPVGVQIGGPGGTHLTNGLTLRDDAFDKIKEGVKQGATHAGDEEANEDARKRVAPVLRAFKNASHQFEQLPPGWEKGMTAAPVDFHSMFPVKDDEWDYYQDHADTAEQVDPADAPRTPTERLAKAVGVTARKDPGGAGRLILAWRRAQIANKGINPDTGVNVVEEREQVQAHINAVYQAELAAAQQKQKEQDQEHADHVKRQAADYQTAQTKHVETGQQQKTSHEATVAKTQVEWNAAQQKKTTAAQHAQQEGVKVQPAAEQKAPPPPIPAEPPVPPPLAKPAPIPVPPPVPLPKPPEQLPAVTLPALPQDPGVSVHAAAAIPPSNQKVQPQSPGVKTAPTGGTPDPMPGTSSNAKQVGGGGGGPGLSGGSSGKGGGGGGGSTSSAPRPGPAVTAGPDGIISQQKTLDAKEKQLATAEGSAPGAATPGKPGVLGKLGGAPTAAGPATAGKPTAGAPAAAPAAGKTAPGAVPAGGLDPTVQKVVEQGKVDEAAYKQRLGQQEQTYTAKVSEDDKATEAEAQKLDKEAEEAKKRKEREKAEAAARAAASSKAASTVGPDGKPLDDKDKKKNKGPIGSRVPLNVDGENHTLYIDEASSVAMVASTPTPVTAKLDEISNSIGAAPAIKALAAATVQEAKSDAQPLAALITKAKGDDAAADAANSELTSQEQKLAGPLKISWAWAKVAIDPAVTGGSIEHPLLHPYYPTFKQRVEALSSAGHISVDAGQFAESIWTKICKAVKAATPQMNDPAAYSNFAKGWLNMKSPEFQKAIREFDALGKEMAKAGSAGFARARNFGFWSKDEGRSLAEAISDLTLETSAIGGLMDGLPTLDAKKAGWDPEIWGALSNAYATAVVPELLKGKKVNVCVGAGVAAGNIWEAVESEALAKGLKGTKLTLESVCTNYAAAAKSKANRRELDDTKHTNSIKGCLFVGDRGGAIAAAEAHWKTLDQPTTTTTPPPGAGPGTAPDKADPTASTGKPLPPGAPIGARVPMTVGKEGHTQFIDPSGKPMVASTPTPVTDKLAELKTKLDAMAPTDAKRAEALAEITHAQSLEHKVSDLAVQVKKGVATATTDLDKAQRELATSVGKIWGIADPGVMDAAKAKDAIDSRVKDCTDISTPLSTEWVGKTRAEFESQFVDPNKLRHAAIAKFLSATPDKAKQQTVGSKDPIAVQKFQDIDAEQHLDPSHGDLKKTFYEKLNAEMVKPEFTDRTHAYQVMKAAVGYSFNLKGTKIPANRITPHASRNHSVEKLYDIAKDVAATKTLIDNEITRALTAEHATPKRIANAKSNDATRRKAYRHLLKTHGNPLSTIDKSKPISPFATWYAPGEITVNTSAPPNQEFARMMTLGALQPEWYPTGTAVLNIDRRLSGATRVLFKPTAFDGLMSALWCARNLGADDYGVTGGGVGEFLEANVPFSDVTSMTVIIPSDDFLADIQRVASEVANKDSSSTPTEEMLRANNKNTKILNTTGGSGVKGMYGQVLDRSAEEQNNPGPSPIAPGATQETSTAMPGKAPAAKQGAFDRVEGPKPSANVLTAPVPTGAPTPAGAPVGLAPTSQAPGVPRAGDPATSHGGGQANDARTTPQTAAGATAKTEHGGLPNESVADAAQRLHPNSARDSHFNPAEKVAFERELARALLSHAGLYDAQVAKVSSAILKYLKDRLDAGVIAGLKGAHEKYVKDLAQLTANSSPGWWGAVEVAANATKEEVANQTRQSLTQGSMPQKMAVHQSFINILSDDFKANVAQAFLGTAAVVPWYVRQETKLKNGQLDKANGVPVFDKANSQERGRVMRPDTHAVSSAGPGIEARGDTGAKPSSVLPTGSDPQQVYRGLDSFTMDEGRDFCQRARLKINMPLAAGVSGSTAELINVAMTMGLAGVELQKYAVAVLAYIGGGGNHSYHEIAIVLAAAGLGIDPDSYHGLEQLVGADLFAELKAKHPDAFHDNPAKPENPTNATGA
jgi:hypothetical protein